MEGKIGNLQITSHTWLEKNVVLLCTESTVDVDGDSYHIEVEAEVPDLNPRFSICYSDQVVPYEGSCSDRNETARFIHECWK